MLFIKIRRIIKGGLINFWRNAWVSLATVLVMSLSLIVIGALVFSKVLLMASLEKIEEKVDVTVYFKSDAAETEILEIKDSLSKLDEVKDVEYISSDTALFAFKERHFNNSLIIQSLEELGTNPLGASLNIKAKNPAQYESIARFLESGAFATVDKVNYSQNKVVIDRLSGILGSV
jgi:cell division transport system permease protein